MPARQPTCRIILIAAQGQLIIERLMPISVMFYGLGPIGAAVARQVVARKGFKIAGGIDIDPAKLGQDLGDGHRPRHAS